MPMEKQNLESRTPQLLPLTGVNKGSTELNKGVTKQTKQLPITKQTSSVSPALKSTVGL